MENNWIITPEFAYADLLEYPKTGRPNRKDSAEFEQKVQKKINGWYQKEEFFTKAVERLSISGRKYNRKPEALCWQ